MRDPPTTRTRRANPALLLCLLVCTLTLPACQRETPPPPRAPQVAPSTPIAPAPVVAPPAPEASPPASAAVAAAESPAPATVAPQPSSDALPSTDFPEGPIYFCDSDATRSPIEMEPKVEQLCRRHPEMGPCQYARNTCRQRGGRVFTAKGEEVTVAVERRYDERVSRVRLQEDGTVRR